MSFKNDTFVSLKFSLTKMFIFLTCYLFPLKIYSHFPKGSSSIPWYPGVYDGAGGDWSAGAHLSRHIEAPAWDLRTDDGRPPVRLTAAHPTAQGLSSRAQGHDSNRHTTWPHVCSDVHFHSHSLLYVTGIQESDSLHKHRGNIHHHLRHQIRHWHGDGESQTLQSRWDSGRPRQPCWCVCSGVMLMCVCVNQRAVWRCWRCSGCLKPRRGSGPVEPGEKTRVCVTVSTLKRSLTTSPTWPYPRYRGTVITFLQLELCCGDIIDNMWQYFLPFTQNMLLLFIYLFLFTSTKLKPLATVLHFPVFQHLDCQNQWCLFS